MYLSLVSLPFLCVTRSHLLVLSEKEKYQLEEDYKLFPGAVIVEHQRIVNVDACTAYLQKKFSKLPNPAVVIQGYSILQLMRHISRCACIESFDNDTVFEEESDDEESMEADETGLTSEVKDALDTDSIIGNEYAFGKPEEVSSEEESEEESDDDFELSSDEDGEKMSRMKDLYRFLMSSLSVVPFDADEDPNDTGDRIFEALMGKGSSDIKD